MKDSVFREGLKAMVNTADSQYKAESFFVTEGGHIVAVASLSYEYSDWR